MKVQFKSFTYMSDVQSLMPPVTMCSEALFPPSFTIDNWFKHAYYRVDWEITCHHLGYIPFDLHGNHSPMAHHCMLKEAHTTSYMQQLTPKLLKVWRWFLLTFNTDQRFYRGLKQPMSPWSKLCLVLKTWRAMANQLSQYFVNLSLRHFLRKQIYY
jgi:hypothetical protein